MRGRERAERGARIAATRLFIEAPSVKKEMALFAAEAEETDAAPPGRTRGLTRQTLPGGDCNYPLAMLQMTPIAKGA